MKPYYDEAGITIYHGDCREVLPGLSADVVLTDPPYGIGLTYGACFEDTAENVAALVSAALPMMRAAAPTVAFTCGPTNIWKYPPATWVLAWFIPGGSGPTPWGFATWQPVLVYGPDPFLARRRGRRSDSFVRSNQGARVAIERAEYGHPCPKPLPAWKRLLLRVSPDETDLILDPFMGSGTTLRAAKDLGRRALGIEIEERYCEIAVKRLAQEVFDFGAPLVPQEVLDFGAPPVPQEVLDFAAPAASPVPQEDAE